MAQVVDDDGDLVVHFALFLRQERGGRSEAPAPAGQQGHSAIVTGYLPPDSLCALSSTVNPRLCSLLHVIGQTR